MKPYNENVVLTDYIWHNYQHLMTGAEKLALKVVLGDQKAASSSLTAMKEAIRQHCGSSEPEVVPLLSSGPDAFRRGVRDRLLHEHVNQISLNRCPNCGRIPRTPEARQCPWCFHSWR
jgi:ribosomal protein L32